MTEPQTATLSKTLSSKSKSNISLFPDESPDSVRVRLSSVIDGYMFDSFVVAVIALNMVFVVYETNATATGQNPAWADAVTGSFLSFFVVEISLRIFVHRRKYFQSRVNILDLGIVTVDVVAQLSVNVVEGTPSVSVMRIFRIMRLLRVIRAASGFRELWLMLHGLVSAFKAMLWASVLIIIVLIIWSVIAVEIFPPFVKELDLEDDAEAFSTVMNAMSTWFLLIFTGNKWEELAIPMMTRHYVTAPCFLCAYVTINFGLMNLILTVIVDRASEARAEDAQTHLHEKQARQQHAKEALERVCAEMDADNSGELTQQEVFSGYESNADFRMTLDLMDVKEEDLKTVWNMMDSDRSGTVSCSEFVDQVHRMKTQESHTMLVFIKHYLNEVRLNVSTELDIVKNTLLKELMREEKALVAELSPKPAFLQPKFVQPRLPIVEKKASATGDVFGGLEQDHDRSEALRKLPAAPSAPRMLAQPLPATLEADEGFVGLSEAARLNPNSSYGSSELPSRTETRQAACSRPLGKGELFSFEKPIGSPRDTSDNEVVRTSRI